jgi:phosphoglycerol transferase
LALIDQTTVVKSIDYSTTNKEIEQDRIYFELIQNKLTQNSAVYQLPYIPFPEFIDVNKAGVYDCLRGYLNTEKIRWSCGSMKGQPEDLWVRTVSEQPIETMVNTVRSAGFSGILLDRYGYGNESKQIEEKLKISTKTEPIVSNNNRFSFFLLKP